MVDVVLESHLRTNLAKLVAKQLPARHYTVVMDTNTAQALGNDVLHALGDHATAVMLNDTPKASQENAELIIAASESAQALIAVGSGTINDLTKYASFLCNKPYGVFPTAPSMNGYSSANASILKDTHKATLPAHAPKAIWCDLSVIATAPIRLIQSGLGDSLCRPTAQFDWLLSHLLLDTPYSPEPFDLLAPYESELFEHAQALLSRDERAVTLLMKTLLASGDGMRMSGGSHPASQAEHMIAHTIEMMLGSPSPHYHGEEIAVTTLMAARRQHNWVAQQDPPSFTASPYPETLMQDHFSDAQCAVFKKEYATKLALLSAAGIQQRFNDNWHEIRAQLLSVMLPLDTLEHTLRQTQMNMTPESLNWNAQILPAIEIASFTRNRFTILDIA